MITAGKSSAVSSEKRLRACAPSTVPSAQKELYSHHRITDAINQPTRDNA